MCSSIIGLSAVSGGFLGLMLQRKRHLPPVGSAEGNADIYSRDGIVCIRTYG
jgi:hypothetical protein